MHGLLASTVAPGVPPALYESCSSRSEHGWSTEEEFSATERAGSPNAPSPVEMGWAAASEPPPAGAEPDVPPVAAPLHATADRAPPSAGEAQPAAVQQSVVYQASVDAYQCVRIPCVVALPSST